MTQVNVPVDRQQFILMKHRRMGGIGIDAVCAPRRNNADRRFGVEHHARLHWRGVRAQHMLGTIGLFRDIERVVHLARRMVGRDVQLGEIVIVKFDIRAFANGKTQIGKDRGDLVHHLADRVDRAAGLWPRRKRHVDTLARQPRIQRVIGQGCFAFGNGICHRVTQRVEGRAVLFALLRAHGAQRFQQLADRSLFAKRGHAHRFQCGFAVCGGNGPQNLALKIFGMTHGNPQTMKRLESRPWTNAKADRLRRRIVQRGFWGRVTLLPDPPEP